MDVEHASAPSDVAPQPTSSQHEHEPSGPVPVNGQTPETEAGPSRRRASTSQPRPASPESTLTPNRPASPHLDLATYPTQTLLRLLASLLQQIATANDQLRPDLDESMDEDDASQTSASETRSINSQPHPSPTTALFSSTATASPSPLDEPLPLFSASRTSLNHPSSLLSFHARHVPSISIEAYLLRILKYCPTTNEVFLGLLVYFDRMSRLGTPSGVGGEAAGAKKGAGRGFAIDSYNVHRLVIAGVTVASKFFSDVFYTNSRYAKVGGLPSHELNQLELQFLLLNDFRLVIPPDEMQRYGDRLLSYWESREAQDEAAETIHAAATTDEATTTTSAPATEPTPPPPQPTPSTHQPAPAPQPAPVAPSPSPSQHSTTRGRDREPARETPTRTAVSFADPPRASSGLRGWVGGGGDVMTGRMTSPMRD